MAILSPYLAEMQIQIEALARDYSLDMFRQHYELLDYKTMSEVAAYGGFPTRYPHWRFGMEYERLSKGYAYGLQKIYELVINNDPCYAYLLEGNSMVEQKMVMAHVCGHNDFFKNNYFFSRTNRRMIDEMANHATRVRRLMDKHGVDEVESFIDVCLSLDNLIDPMSMFITRQRGAMSEDEIAEAQRPKQFKLKAKSYMDSFINPQRADDEQERKPVDPMAVPKIPQEPTRDILQFLLEHAPLQSWQRDVLSVVREEAYYFAPQGMTKIMNEGWATYWHSTIMTQKALKTDELIEYADQAAGVLSGGMPLNPYKIGLELFRYIEERWNKGRFGKEWNECDDIVTQRHWDRQLGLGRQKIFEVRKIYSDVTFIDEFFTEDFCREQLFFSFGWSESNDQWEIQSRQYHQIKNQLLTMLTNFGQPVIYVEDGNFENRSELLIRHQHEGTDLRVDWANDTLQNLYKVWRRPVNLHTKLEEEGTLLRFDGSEVSQKSADSI